MCGLGVVSRSFLDRVAGLKALLGQVPCVGPDLSRGRVFLLRMLWGVGAWCGACACPGSGCSAEGVAGAGVRRGA